MSQKLKVIVCALLFGAVFGLSLLPLIHETGHALIALMYGGEIDSFVIFGLNAHVIHHGASFSVFGQPLHYAAGMLLPIIIGAIVINFYKSSFKSACYHFCFFIASIGLASSVLPWIAIPIISLFAPPPPRDDVTKFLNITGIHPLLISLGALLLLGAFVFLAVRKGIFLKIKELSLSFRKQVRGKQTTD